MKKKLLLFGLCILLSLLVTACNRETTFIPLIIQNNGSATGDCTCTFSREYNTTFELSNLFYPLNSNPYNYVNDTSNFLLVDGSRNVTGNLTVNGNLSLSALITFNGSSGSNGSISAGLNGDGEKSITMRSSQSIDYFLGSGGFLNVYNRSGSWVFYVRETTGQITTRNEGTSTNWYSAYKKMSNQGTNTTSDVTFDIVNATRFVQEETFENFYGSRIIEDDMCGGLSSIWTGGSIASGTSGQSGGLITHPCTRYLRPTASSANSGYYFSTGNTNLVLNGGESTDFIFYKNSRSGVNSSVVRFGFLDSMAVSLPVDGVWITINNLTVYASVRSNSVEVNSSTNFNLTEGFWYRLHIDVVNTSKADFYLYNSTNSVGDGNTVQLWNDNITGTIPTGTSRQTGHAVMAYVNGNSTAVNILEMDYVNLKIDRELIR